MSTSSEEHALNQLQVEQSKLLDKIDELRNLGIGGLVELPQLIVCGNQSSGKSSVLEAISRVRFPAKGNVCTRFATEVILRRSPQARVKVSIEPGASRTDDLERARLQSFTSESFSTSDDLPDLIKKAEECMRMDGGQFSTAGFSDDVLNVEIFGPEKPELSLVDLPGLYNSVSDDQNEEGMILVNKLTRKYMENKRSIILAVISTKLDYHLQPVLNMAGEIDPGHERTLGIVTQPDTLSPGSEEEDTYLKFINNEKLKLQLGWHVLCNRKFETSKTSDDERDRNEREVLERGRWASLSRDIVGIDSLRRRLSNVLLKHIRRSLPDLISDIQKKILDHEQRLANMGTARPTVKDQRRFLVDISSKFGRITDQALNGMYSDNFFGGLDDQKANENTHDLRRLRAVIREMNENFAEALSIRGCRRVIRQTESSIPFSTLQQQRSKPYMDGWVPAYVNEETLQEEIKKQAVTNRGIELPGNANQMLVGTLFRDQSEPWEKLAEDHLEDVWNAVNSFVGLVLWHLTDKHTYPLLMRDLIIPEMDRLRACLFEKLQELTSYRSSGHPLPLGKNFLSKIQESRKKRQLAVLKKELGLASSPFFPRADDLEKTFNASDLDRAASQLQSSGDQFAAAEIIDQMQAYYDTAIVTFIDNVATLAIENCLLRPLEHIFTGQAIIGMEDTLIQSIAAEPPNVNFDRNRLNEELIMLHAGRQTLSAFSTNGPSRPSRPVFVSQLSSRSETSSPSRQANGHQRGTSRSGRSPSGLSADFGRPKSQNNASPGLFTQNSTVTDNLSPSPFSPRAPSPSGGSSNTNKSPPISKGFPFGQSGSGSAQSTPNNGIFNTSLSGFASSPPLGGGSSYSGRLFGSAHGPLGGTSNAGVQDSAQF